MLHAALQACAERSETLVPAVDYRQTLFARRRIPGILHLIRTPDKYSPRMDKALSLLTAKLPSGLLNSSGFARSHDVDVIFDASGFKFSDQWNPAIGRRDQGYFFRWKSGDKKLILLPQAFGPFETTEARELMLDVLEVADLVFARDSVSLEHLTSLGESHKVRYAPDFTNLIEAPIAERGATHDDVIVIPNLRMVDRGGFSRIDYMASLGVAIARLSDAGAEVSVMAHESGDRDLVRELGRQYQVKTIVEVNPIALKARIAQAKLVISSRFHGLVSALSQGVPSIGVGWSHKYAELFADYDARDCLVTLDDSGQELADVAFRELDDAQQTVRRGTLLERSAQLKSRSKSMWNDVFTLVM